MKSMSALNSVNILLTVTGLKKAISALDSGVVYISYPGLWDTTGLGAIPN